MGDGGGLALTFLFAFLLIGGLVLLVVVGIRALLGGIAASPTSGAGEDAAQQPAYTRSEARRLLDERYARGELSTEEYREHVDNLDEEA